MAELLINTTWLFAFSVSQAAKEKRFLELCYDGTANIRDFLSLLAQEVEPNIYDEVGATAWQWASICVDVLFCMLAWQPSPLVCQLSWETRPG